MALEKNLECTICSRGFEIANVGGVDGYFGVMAVSFCPDCYASMEAMVGLLNEDEDDE